LFLSCFSGEFSIHVNAEDGISTKKVGTYKGSGFFGELALMYNQPRAATIIAETDGSLWGMARDTFKRLVALSAYKKRSMHEDLLTRVPMLSALEVSSFTSTIDL
jgi:cAMP-dependent protein kinase regulator